jgi:nucleoside-diphosphate-sugar epimerase
MKERVLITGGAGYIGSVLTPSLLKLGYVVTVIDNFMYGQTSLLDCCSDPKFKIIRGDIRDNHLVTNEVEKTDWIIPLACLTGAPACDKNPFEADEIIVRSIENILRWRNDNQKIIFPATNSGYGVGQDTIECDESSPLRPISLYGRLKVRAEEIILNQGNSLTLRLATVFCVSPRMRLDLLVNDFVNRAVTDRFVILFEPHFKRNYIHVRDVVRAFIFCMQNFEKMRGQPYNLGLSDANLSKLELCENIKKQLPDFYYQAANIGKDPDKRHYIVSNAKIEAAGFKPEFSLADGITELIKSFQIIRRNQFSNL